MRIEQLFNELIELNVHVGLQGDDISIKGLKKEDAPVVIPKIKAHKTDLIAYLKSLENINHEEFSAIPKVSLSESYPVSPSQYRLWVLSQFEEGSIAYNIPTSIVLDGNYDIACLKKAINAVMERHEILRTVFRENKDGELQQYILSKEAVNFKISYQDYSQKEHQKSLIDTYIATDSNTPFNLSNGPLLRVSLLKTAADNYVLFYNMHHIISDGWSMNILANDVLKYYEAYKKDEKPALPELRIQYKEYASWQLQQLKSSKYETHKSFWRKQLEGNVSLLDLPSEARRPRVMTFNGRNLGTVIKKEDTQHLKAYCKEKGGSLFMGIIAVWKVLFSKYTSQNDIIIGTPVAGRNHVELESQIGFYVNTLLLRNEIDQKLTFDKQFENIIKNTLACFEHQDYPFDGIVTDLKLEKDTSRNPLFDVMITLANAENTNEAHATLIDDAILVDNGACLAKFDIDITFQEIAGQLHFNITYNTDVYEAEMIKNLLKHYKSLLRNILADTSKNISELNYLLPADIHELLHEFNNFNKTAYPKHQTILDVFATQVQNVPNNLAVSFDNTSLSFQELDEVSNQLANFINANCTIELEDFIGIQLERSEWVIISIFAVLKLGGAYVPIDPAYPEDRIKYIEEDSNCKLMIDAELIQQFNTEKTQHTTQFKSPHIQPNNLAYAIYTSGSTGQPKGVLVEHASVVNIHYGWRDAYKLDTFQVNLLQFANFSFDMSVADICRSILNGGHMVICSNELKFDQEGLHQLITKFKISMFEGPPALIMPLVEYLKEQNLAADSLKLLVLGGEKVTFAKFDFLVNHFGDHIRIINSYGVTEATVDTTYFEYDKNYTINKNISMPIGIPFPNNTVYILDAQNKLVPKGVVGEMCIGGLGITRGYLNKKELTQKKFIEDPFVAGGSVYKTGDLGRWLNDGNIEYIGREDDQVKLRGYRIELGEIEKKLLTKEAVKEVVVQLLKSEETDNDQLVAYITAETSQNANELNNYLITKLPPYMLPNSYYQLDIIPLTPNGKIDKKALQSLEEEYKLKGEYVPPTTPEEIVLANTWEKVLRREHIGIKDNFYSLGGDSIKSIQVISQLKRNGYALKIDLLLSIPVLENLAKHIKKAAKSVKKYQVDGTIALSPIQQAFIQDKNIKVPNYYNQSILLKFTEIIAFSKLNAAFRKLVAHHDGLRLRFDTVNNNWVQYIAKFHEEDYAVEIYDLRNEVDAIAKMEEIGTQLQSSFQLKNASLFKMVIFRLHDGDRLAMISHHLIMDGISWRIIMEDLGLVYSQKESNTNVLQFKSDSYLSWVRCQQEYIKNGHLNTEKEIWEEIADSNIPSLPTDFEFDTENVKINENISFTLDTEKTAILKTEINGIYNTSISDVLLLNLSTSLQKVFGIQESLVLLEGHGREDIDKDIDISRTIGWFTTNYPFVLKAADSSNPLSSLLKLKKQLKRIPNNGIGYGILSYLSDELAVSIQPTIEFNYLGDFDGNSDQHEETGEAKADQLFEFSSESIGLSTHADNTSETVLLVTGMIVKGEFVLTISYGNACYKTETIQQLVDSFETSLHETIAHLTSVKAVTEDIYKLAPRQKWMYEQQHGISQKRNFSQSSYRLKNVGLSKEKIQLAYQKLLSKHAVLRTSFKNIEGDVYQVVNKDVSNVNLTFIKIPTTNNETEIATFIKKIKSEEIQQQFDFTSPALMRLKFIEIQKDTYELIWSFHHIILDGWSIGLLIQDFMQMLLSNTENIHQQKENSVAFSNYINWVEMVDAKKSLNYWSNYLANYTKTVVLPSNTLKEPKRAEIMHKQTLKISDVFVKEIKEVCAKYSITQNIFMQGVWGYLLSKYNGTTDVVFGTLVSGRSDEIFNVDSIIGLLTNLIPVRLSYTEKDKPSDILKALQKSWIHSLYHHHIDFSEIEKTVATNNTLINNVLTFQNFPTDEIFAEESQTQTNQEATNAEIELTSAYERSSFDFNIEIKPTKNEMLIEFSYDGIVYNSGEIQNLIHDFEDTIKHFVQNSTSHLKVRN
ncbi:linear gramicidin synthase subunit D [Kordia sp. SMS9]|uniref:non-ribosomal peptide synthetase n=1 Tax=Kordia sp. SMS9 TaxID=2282170 RepID=UPI000E0E0625|nr:non-ribosomal peptide synthetase [Kordia sp. SMS9]AXG70693.1 linear gramicidin synthase subunit D [Kordia sp. SMS9]